MEVNSLFKLKAGSTVYLVYMDRGLVVECYVQKMQSLDGFPAMTSIGRTIMAYGMLASPAASEEMNVWFFSEEPEASKQIHRQTRSRKQAIRWAKEGMLGTKIEWELPEGVNLRMGPTIDSVTAEVAQLKEMVNELLESPAS